MYYNIAAIPTTYRGVNFRSRLEAKWAVLLDLMDWDWEYEPIDFNGWIPDFYVNLPACPRCTKFKRDVKKCYCIKSLYVEVKPIRDVEEFKDPAVIRCRGWEDDCSPAIAVFGLNPRVTRWTSANCGAGTVGHVGIETAVSEWVDLDAFWTEAGNIVQWKGRR